MNGSPKKRSPWAYVAIGCGAALLLALLGLVGAGVFVYRKGKQIEAEMKDPAARAAKVRDVLGGEPPAGYHPVFALSVPFVMDMAMLGDQPPNEKGEPGERMSRGFVYVQSLSTGGQQDELEAVLRGQDRRRRGPAADEDPHRRQGDHPAGRARRPGQDTLYLSQRGGIAMEEKRSDGLTTLLLIDCPQDTRQRLGIWFGPDPAPGEPVEKVDWTGSVADEAAMREFIAHFKLCGK